MIEFIVENLQEELDLKLLIIFGSFAKKNQSKESDIDLAFLSSEEVDNLKRWQISNKLAILLNRDVDLIDLSKANDVLKFQIVSTGEVVYNDSQDEFLDRVYLNYLQLNDDRREILENYER